MHAHTYSYMRPRKTRETVIKKICGCQGFRGERDKEVEPKMGGPRTAEWTIL